MVFMGDRATLLETGRFVQQRGQDAESAVDAAFVAAIAGTGAPVQRTGAIDASAAVSTSDEDTTDAVDAADSAESEARHRRAADAGDTASMSVLGALLLRRGELDSAERYLRAATADGDRAAANNLGVLLHQRGYPDEAAGWWRIAAVALSLIHI
ncbi:tetratricopeptide repeat protein, partial [Streptomyces sp. wa1071]|uniref:tetratricopeptide repeat protein n=1 Tax=Streptomyces sp. wa1071 TaxID=1828217 RepID=UPI00118027FE